MVYTKPNKVDRNNFITATSPPVNGGYPAGSSKTLKRYETIDGKTLTGHCVKASLEKKAQDVEVLDLSGIAIFADYFIICSGSSTRQVRAIAEEIEETLSKLSVEPHHIEGAAEGRWILMDYGETVVHLFLDEARQYYNLERLWGDAPRLEVEILVSLAEK